MTDDVEYKISEEPPRDDEGHPIHPERGHRICGAVKSDKTTPTSHGRERDEYEYCLLPAGWGKGEDVSVGACSKHPVTGPQFGESNPNYKHGGYAKVIGKGYADDEKDAIDEIADILAEGDLTEQKRLLATQAAEAYVRYQRSRDTRHLREYRQLIAKFNIVDNTERVEVATVDDWREYISDDE